MQIWLAEDEAPQREHLAALLRQVCAARGVACELRAFEDGQALVDAYAPGVDLLLLDIDMPGMNGIELAMRLREMRRDIIIVFITAHPRFAVEAFQMKADYMVFKPFDRDDIQDVLERARLLHSRQKKRVQFHTFGNFEVLYNGTPLVFEREKAKELLALLIDRQGLSMTNGEIEAFLWEELHSPQYLQTLFYSLRKTLRGIGFEDLLIRTRNHTSIDVSKLHCDLYEFLKGSADAVNSYAGEYMNNYSWAELTNARLYNGTFSDFVLAAQARSRR